MSNHSTTEKTSGTTFFISVVVVASALGFLFSARTQGLFACQATERITDQYVGMCNVRNYGDYDHGAFWFGLEPSAFAAAGRADVLFLGNSRLQFALSTQSFEDWFRFRAENFYLLGFSHSENYLFVRRLLDRLEPAAKMYVINVDKFFGETLTGPANSVLNEPESETRYREKRRWQTIHRLVCGHLTFLCGNESSYVRKRSDGLWTFSGATFLAANDFSERVIVYNDDEDLQVLFDQTSRANGFLAALNSEENCIVLTNVPGSETSLGTAKTLAANLKLPFVAPPLSGLTTFDGSHLEPASAERWSVAFLSALKPHVENCFRHPD